MAETMVATDQESMSAAEWLAEVDRRVDQIRNLPEGSLALTTDFVAAVEPYLDKYLDKEHLRFQMLVFGAHQRLYRESFESCCEIADRGGEVPDDAPEGPELDAWVDRFSRAWRRIGHDCPLCPECWSLDGRK